MKHKKAGMTVGQEKKDGFVRFQKECEKQILKLGLLDWDISFSHRELEGEYENTAATTEISVSGKIAHITLNKRFQHLHPERIGKHEVAHILLGKLEGIAESRFVNERELSNEIEGLATVLEKVL